jgi:DNA-binding GntR family transcriptional regulator
LGSYIYLRPEHAEVVEQIESAREPVLRLVERHYGARITEVVQQIVAAKLTAAQARVLKAAAGTPALHVTRQYFDTQDRSSWRPWPSIPAIASATTRVSASSRQPERNSP